MISLNILTSPAIAASCASLTGNFSPSSSNSFLPDALACFAAQANLFSDATLRPNIWMPVAMSPSLSPFRNSTIASGVLPDTSANIEIFSAIAPSVSVSSTFMFNSLAISAIRASDMLAAASNSTNAGSLATSYSATYCVAALAIIGLITSSAKAHAPFILARFMVSAQASSLLQPASMSSCTVVLRLLAIVS